MKLLIDADMLLRKVMHANEVEECISQEVWTRHADLAVVRQEYQHICTGLAIEWDCRPGDLIHCFTSGSGFRKRVTSTYKLNRIHSPKPIGWLPMKQEILTWDNAYLHDDIEADDLLGIFATRLRRLGEDYVVMTHDKDLDQVPGRHVWKWAKPPEKEEDEDRRDFTRTEGDAQACFWRQVLIGDRTDNVRGVDGVGVKGAEKIVSQWDVTDPASCWKETLSLFEKNKINKVKVTKEEAHEMALTAARLIYILREQDYNFKTGEVTLWNPPALKQRRRSLVSG